MRETRAFAAVAPNGVIALSTMSNGERAAEIAAGNQLGNWPEAQRRGWRIRPVLIRVEDNGGGDAE